MSMRQNDRESSRSFVARCAELARLGIEHAVMIKSGAWTPEAISVLAAALPELHDLGPASGTRS